ncbi:MAG TPA: CusA/CzcA family heavy metal efflux RND transporter, partial [Thermoanaerobaculia bacterium]|nr:CusA/CzcA family heavy metal efflux RND transporter [Thermoanaerobaculia bacterium]
GLSLITMVFADGVGDYFARQRIQERVNGVTLPPNAAASLDPVTAPTGEIYRYTLESKTRGQRELRELQEWVVIPTLKQVPGIADVTNFGGETTQFQIELDPNQLLKYNVSLKQIRDTIQANNANAGGSILPQGELGAVVRGVGLIQSLNDLGNVVVTQKNGVPIFLSDLGTVRLGALQRSGILGKDNNADAVEGIVLLLRGENPSHVLDGIHQKIRELNGGLLPKDVRVVPYLDRTTLIENTLHTVSHTILEGMGLVVIVLIIFLGSPRSALAVAITIPLALLIAFILMNATHIPANLLSLGAIDFGILVDAAIVVYDNILKRREQRPDLPLTEDRARVGAVRVARQMFFATAIIITAYLPLFAFERVEAKLFTPMAYTVGYALMGAILVALALIPSLALVVLSGKRRPPHPHWLERLNAQYRRGITRVAERPALALIPGAIAAIVAIALSVTIGRDFLPNLDEGSIWLQVQLPPGLTLEKANELSGELRKAAREFPEVSYIVTQLGRNDDGTDPWTYSHIEASIGLRPYGEWGGDKARLIERMGRRFEQIPGLSVGFSQPMIDGVNDKIAGAHSELVLKVFGRDFAEMRRVATEVTNVLQGLRGAADVAIDQEPPLPQLKIDVDREAAARIGVNVADVADLIEIGIGGRALGQVFKEDRVYDIAARYMESVRDSPDAIGRLLLVSATGARVPLGQVARISMQSGESTITREMNRRHLTVKLNLRGRDLASFLEEAKSAIQQKVQYDPAAISLEWGGSFENQQRAQARLAVIIPLTLLVIFGLLYVTFGTLRHAAVILAVVPLSIVGGMAALHIRGMTLNVSSAVGFIALFGVAVQNGVIMIGRMERARAEGKGVIESVIDGASDRFRPVLMTATVATLGLLPAALARGIGSDVQRPLATVIVGGLSSATLLTLFVLPALYLVAERSHVHAHVSEPEDEEEYVDPLFGGTTA